jgi:diguanylate cyclase (GGDEF)-like protein
MPPAIAQATEQSLESVPSLLNMVADLKSSLTDLNGAVGVHGRHALDHLLQVADETEHKLAEQSHRIQFLECLSVTDELTGLYNRRGFVEVINRTLAMARRYNESGMLAYLDLDDFKAVNDTFGHAAGDAVLTHVAKILLQSTRSTDFLCRIGGDEFAVVFVRADQSVVRERAEALRDQLNSASVSVGNAQILIRASLGLEPYGPDTTREELLRRADERMYLDKRGKTAIARIHSYSS